MKRIVGVGCAPSSSMATKNFTKSDGAENVSSLHMLFEASAVAGFASIIAQSRGQPSVQAELAQLVTEVENLAEEEAQQLLLLSRLESIR